MRQFQELFRVSNSDRIIDIGGTEFNWQFVDAQPPVLLVNITGDEWEKGRFKKVVASGTRLDYPDNAFDIAYSNSVIEHVGGWPEIERFAREVRRLAPRYYVQTPNKYFFAETHLMAVLIHLLPFNLQRKLVRYFTIWGLLNKPDQAETDTFLSGLHLLSGDEFQRLFPDARILRERFLGMTKSFIAVKV